jgi:hypothetical protein
VYTSVQYRLACAAPRHAKRAELALSSVDRREELDDIAT